MASMRVLFVAPHRPGRSPSQRFRFEQYLDDLKSQGLNVELSFLISAEDDKVFYTPGKLLSKARIFFKSYQKRKADLRRIHEFDAVYVQREAFMTGNTFFEEGVAKSKAKLIFDFDDSIWLQNVSDANKYLNFLKNPEKTAKIISLADEVVAGNQYLADYALQYNQNVRIIPTTIDTEGYQRENLPERDYVTIGWSGSVTTIQHFRYALDVLKRVKDKYGDRVKIKVIGDANYSNTELGVQGIGWKEATEVHELSEFDIGIMPLPNDLWANGKCGLKGLQYMALEIPTIMSPVGVNSEIIDDGKNGFLADAEDEWFEKICRLVDDEALRKQLGKAGRQTVIDRYSVEANKPLYRQLFLS